MNNINQKHLILTDIDGVCLYWEEHFHRRMQRKGHIQHTHGVYDIYQMYSVSKNEGERLSREFCNSSWIAFCPPYQDAQSGIATLVEKGYEFVGVTSLSDDPYTKELRWKNLVDLFGSDAFVDLYCLDPTVSKKHTLEQWQDTGTWWIEDLPYNAQLGADLGLKTLLVDHTYNRDMIDPRITRVADWKHIVKHITDHDGT
jgi:hypothetical protein